MINFEVNHLGKPIYVNYENLFINSSLQSYSINMMN